MINKWIIRGVLLLSVITVIQVVLSYLYAVNSEEYRVAIASLQKGKELHTKYGDDTPFVLVPWKLSARESGDVGYAKFYIYVNGEKGSGFLYVYLEKTVKWKLVKIQY